MNRVGNRTFPPLMPAERDHEVEGHRTGSKPLSPRGRGGAACRGFTLVELLTVIAIVAVLATLLFSVMGGARTRSRQVVCRNNLRQIAVASEIYHDDTGRRPRSYTRLATRPVWLSNPRSLLCPSDPAFKAAPSAVGNQGPKQPFWGNRVNASQEPLAVRIGQPDEASWEAEVRETTETVGFSYLHPLGWRREAWQRLAQLGNQSGVSACQLHGMRLPGESRRAFAQYEGQTLRAQRDGAVVSRRIFRTPTTGPVTTSTGNDPVVWPVGGDPVVGTSPADDYPWEFYADGVPPMPRCRVWAADLPFVGLAPGVG
jgi:prepilin-type N-terminal cleavage/methylation domain-containing protein